MTAEAWPPEDMAWGPVAPWQSTWRCGPGAHQEVVDELELGRRVSVRWASGRVGCVTRLASPHLLRRMDAAPPPHYPCRPGGLLPLLADEEADDIPAAMPRPRPSPLVPVAAVQGSLFD